MIDPLWLALALKMAFSAAIVVAASILIERVGPFIGAMIATLPISAGPAYTFLALEHGAGFIERSTLPSLAVNAATFAFVAIYAHLAQRQNLFVALGTALGLWLLAAVLIERQSWTLQAAVALNILAYIPAFWSTRAFRKMQTPRAPKGFWWDVPLRAVLVMFLVAAVVILGRLAGPAAAGIAALVPIVLTSLVIILHPRIGGSGTAAVLANALPGLFGFGCAVTLLHLTAVSWGAIPALFIALVTCVVWNLGLGLQRRMAA